MVAENVLPEIISAAEISPADTVLEIGMGTGILTAALAKRAGQVISVEIDRELYAEYAPRVAIYPNVRVICGDFLREAEDIFRSARGRLKVIANIPYYITTPILEKLLEYRARLSTVVLMVQKEVAERICAAPCSGAYGSLTIFLRYYADARLICLVTPECFRPRPQVDSAVLRLDIRPELKYQPLSEKRFFNIVRGAFWGRRKTLRNTLKQAPYTHYTAAMLAKLERETGLDLNRRGETLSIEEFVHLANVDFASETI
ncbi:16S rRNA (adenine1518-N6/adenine1519-N6)-dimethyltransferase [Candidatus Termititenax aidoneus]|uniref:Ribosomal RNA small subunit methyltransferase A n=1 Tax=Termititenax aidoneus TaxID=2218524 RepID=A0A388TBA7_TERA1|nr:16S rRNA (adenine1518-N6/adenine1519-N6)-dimethyltransferase [Candidatus Termititenax aidoneus]